MKRKLLTAALVAATVLSLPALADGGGKIRPNYRDGGSQVSRGEHRDSGRQAGPRSAGRSGSYGNHQDSNWRHDGRYDRRDFWADSYRHNQQHGGYDGGHGGNDYGHGGYNSGGGRYDHGHGGYNYGRYGYNYRGYGHGGHNHGYYGGSSYYAPRWYGGNPYRYSYGVGYGPWHGGCGYDDRYDHWDGYRWQRTYCDDAGFLFYYGAGGVVIQLSSW